MKKKLFVALICVMLAFTAFACEQNQTDPVTLTQPGGGAVTLAGTNKTGEEVTVNVVADKGYVFRYLTVNGAKVYADTYTFKVTEKTEIAAVLVAETDLKVKAEAVGNGDVTLAFLQDKGNESVKLTATAAENYKFVGWYTEDKLLSKDSAVIVAYDETKQVAAKAKFVYSPIAGIMRVVAGAYNKYEYFPQSAAEWNDFYFDVDLGLAGGESYVKDDRYQLSARGLWETYNKETVEGTETLLPWTHTTFDMSLTDLKSKAAVFELYFADNRSADDNLSDIYLNINGKKYHFNFLSVSTLRSLIENAATPAPDVPQPDQPLPATAAAAAGTDDGELYEILDEMLISQNWVTAAEEDNKVIITVNVGEILRTLDAGTLNIIAKMAGIDLSEVIKFFEENKETLKALPDIALTIEATLTGETPTLNQAKLSLTVNGFEVEQQQVGGIYGSLAINKATFQHLATAADKKTYFELLNDKDLTGYNEDEDTLDLQLHAYADISNSESEEEAHRVFIDIFGEIKPGAVLSAVGAGGFDYTAIDYNHLGFINLRAYEKDESGNETVYLNVLYDDNNFYGSDRNLLVYLKLRQPLMGFLLDYPEISFSANLGQLVQDVPAFIERVTAAMEALNPPAETAAAMTALSDEATLKDYLLSALVELVKPLIFTKHTVPVGDSEINLEIGMNDDNKLMISSADLLPFLYSKLCLNLDIGMGSMTIDLISS